MLSNQAAAVANGPAIDGKLVRTIVDTPLGSMTAVADDAALYLLEFENRVALTGEPRRLERDFGLIGLGSNTVLEILVAQLEDYFAGRVCSFPDTYRSAWHSVSRSRLAGFETDSSWADTQLW